MKLHRVFALAALASALWTGVAGSQTAQSDSKPGAGSASTPAAAATAPVPRQSERPKLGDELFEPMIGQMGKDVIWVPTQDSLAQKLLTSAGVKPTDLVYDLGAGDGKIAILAAKNFGANAVGIEYKAEMADLARRNAKRAGVEDKVKIITGDIFVEDFSKATVVTLYLLPDLNLKLRPTLLKMTPGTRILANSFNMGDWEPDEIISVGSDHGYRWVVPSWVAGNWEVTGIEGAKKVQLSLAQSYQQIGGTLTIDGKSQPILSPRLDGSHLTFRYLDHAKAQRVFDVNVLGDKMSGNVLENVPIFAVSARRL
ncbi:MAG: methyltransferase domain-containing protein [Burkholderiaceae bacterium]|nr:methyltransferase domain-containing protein [Burkholderiaceae bacterium]